MCQIDEGGPSLPQRVKFISKVAFLILSFKGDSLEETLVYSKLEFSSPVPLVYLFKNGSCQFLSHWAGSQLIQCFAVRNSVVFLAKTKTKAWFSVIWRENSNLLYDETIYVRKQFFHQATFSTFILTQKVIMDLLYCYRKKIEKGRFTKNSVAYYR